MPCHCAAVIEAKGGGPSTKCSEMIFDMYSINISCIIITYRMSVEISHDFIHLAIAKFEHDQLPISDTVLCQR
jgi:hypothetical protein